jgi:deoxyribodipyrimidine photo-lyase
VWFRRDLRLTNNPAWSAAVAAHADVVALYVLDPRARSWAGTLRARQHAAELHALDRALAEVGGRLLVRSGVPAEVVPTVARRWPDAQLYWNDDVSPYAQARDAAVVAGLDRPPRTWWGHIVLPPGSVLTNEGSVPLVFGAFHRRWSSTPWDPWPSDDPAVPSAAQVGDDPGDGLPAATDDPPRPAGEGAADEALRRFIERAEGYPDGRDDLAHPVTSELSVALHFGTISAREVAIRVGTDTPARAAFVRQLAWRDWYAHLLHARPELVGRSLRPEYDDVAWVDDQRELDAWKAGTTGYPLVDAAMRELAATGTIHNRARMVAASFLVKDLLIDWRVGERHFRRHLLDSDVAQNVGNWQWVAGTGPDAAPYFRVFNPVTQSRKHDPEGAYLRKWLPELAGLDDRAIHAPWEAPPLELAAAGVELGTTYPEPVVDHGAARERTIAAYQEVRA